MYVNLKTLSEKFSRFFALREATERRLTDLSSYPKGCSDLDVITWGELVLEVSMCKISFIPPFSQINLQVSEPDPVDLFNCLDGIKLGFFACFVSSFLIWVVVIYNKSCVFVWVLASFFNINFSFYRSYGWIASLKQLFDQVVEKKKVKNQMKVSVAAEREKYHRTLSNID